MVNLKVAQKHPVQEGRGCVHALFEGLLTVVKVYI